MMMTKIQAEKIAAAVQSLRPDWDTTGVLAALAKARTEGEPWQVAIAAIAAAADRDNLTPGVIPLPGLHWKPARLNATPTPGPGRRERCQVYGHDGYPALNCPGCRADELVNGKPTDLPPAPEPHGRELAAGKD